MNLLSKESPLHERYVALGNLLVENYFLTQGLPGEAAPKENPLMENMFGLGGCRAISIRKFAGPLAQGVLSLV